MSDLSTLDTDDLRSMAVTHLDATTIAFDEVDELLDALVDRDSLAVLLYDLAELKRRLAEVYAHCEARLINEAGEKSFVIPNLGKFEVRSATKRTKWDWDRLVPTLVQKARQEMRLDSTTGEVESEGEATARVLRDTVSISSAKLTGLRARDIDPDEWCVVGEQTFSVQLPPRDL